MRFLFLLGLIFALSGCAKVREGAKETGRPLGKTMDALSGVSEGALEGYINDKQPNPYQR